ncbi:hypothetical protein [Macrococcus bovicus]|uniref:Uncharacterized protein n=1 Tax=Macrococcus bovicus TaxID=69968 RepID=A0A4R6C2Y4_9STAP|nr:hypothetical protein [Macrococcus bovicus]TDM15695.1 hypothetical protein ERX55_01955 [Macrococcus bovicus]
MTIPNVGTDLGSDFRNIINLLIDVVNGQSNALQTLVAEGQLTDEQYSDLLILLNALIKKGEVTVADINTNLGKIGLEHLSDAVIKAIAGTAPVNAVPADKSITTLKLNDKAVTARKTSFFSISTNKYNKNTTLRGKSVDVDGTIIDDTTRWLSDFIELDESKIINFTRGTYRIGVYTKDKVWITRSGVTDSSQYNASSYPDARCVRLSNASLPYDTVMVNAGSALLPYEEFYEKLKSESAPLLKKKDITDFSVTPNDEVHFKKSANLYNRYTLQKDTSMDTTGVITAEVGRYLSEKIAVKSTDVVYAKVDNIFRYCLYDADNKPLTSRLTKVSGVEKLTDFSPYTKAAYMLVSPVEIMKDTIMLNKGTAPLPYEDYGYTLISTPQYPIKIDSAIVPVGTGTGGTSTGTGIAGTQQISKTVSGTYATTVVTDVYSTTSISEVDYLTLSANNVNAEVIITSYDKTGASQPYVIINPSDNSKLPLTIANIVKYGFADVEFLQYDDGASQYKLSFNGLKFSNGFKVQIKNAHTANINITAQLEGRYYV